MEGIPYTPFHTPHFLYQPTTSPTMVIGPKQVDPHKNLYKSEQASSTKAKF